jgi:chromosome segregation ATPase
VLEWLWPGRVPLGKLTRLAGDPGLGKSFVTLDMAARVSRGERLPALRKARAQLDAQIAAADRVRKEAEAAHDEATRPLYERRSEVDRAIREAQDAEAKLVTKCEDAELRRELEDVDAELIRLSTDRHDLLDQASHLEKQALAEQDRAERQLDPGYARQCREKAAQIEKNAAARRRDAQRVEKAHDELTKRRDRPEKQMRQA